MFRTKLLSLIIINILYFNTIGLCQLKQKNDSLLYTSLLKSYVNKIIYTKDSSLFIIAGKNKEKLIRIDDKGIIEDIAEKYNLPPETCFSDVLCMSNSRVMIGTKNNYIYFLRGKKKIWLNDKYGLTDRNVENFDYDKKLKLVVIKTAKARYLLKNENKIRNIRFVEIKDTVSTLDEIEYYFKYKIQRPVQQKFLKIVSDVDFSFRKNKYLNDDEMVNVRNKIEPGDILLRRNEYALTNIGIPGFWKHSGIYIGDLDKLNSYFEGLPMLNGQLPADYISENYPDVFEQLINQKDRIIEAIGEGVVIKPITHIANTDYFVILRTHLDKEDLFKSMMTSFEYLGTPYDYLFDFSNDDELVCTELLYNAYSPKHDKKGIIFKLGELDGKPFLSPNDIAKQYSKEQKDHNQQLSLVYFFDADLFMKKGICGNENGFCKSWKRK